jgi:hypothetical protein
MKRTPRIHDRAFERHLVGGERDDEADGDVFAHDVSRGAVQINP